VIDTGSGVTGLMRGALQPLGIEPFDRILICTPSTEPDSPHACDQYDVSLSLVSGGSLLTFPSIHVIAPEDFSREEGIQALIGRDVLDRCVFEYFGPHKQFRLSF
jgi:hypothetical protein